MEEEAAGATLMMGTAKVKSGLEYFSGVSLLGLSCGCSTLSSSGMLVSGSVAAEGEIRGVEAGGEADLVVMIHRLHIVAFHPRSSTGPHRGLDKRDGDQDSGVEHWVVPRLATWQAIVGKLSDLEIISLLALCGGTMIMEKEARVGEVVEERGLPDLQARRFRRQGMKALDLDRRAGGNQEVVHRCKQHP